jgi:hypothetical protein
MLALKLFVGSSRALFVSFVSSIGFFVGSYSSRKDQIEIGCYFDVAWLIGECR